MHLRSRKYLQSGDRSKRRCIWAAEGISKAATEAKKDTSMQPKVSPKRQKKQTKMHLRSRRHLQSGDRSKRGCVCAAESISKVETEAKEDASGQPKVSPKWRQKQKRMHLCSSKASLKAKRRKRRCIYAAESIFKVATEAKEDASAQPKVSLKRQKKQKKMHLRSRKHLQSAKRRKRRCICAAESIFTSPTEAKEDASAQPESIFTSPEGKQMHKMRKSSLTNILTMI